MPAGKTPLLWLRASLRAGAALSLFALIASAPLIANAQALVRNPPGSATTREVGNFTCDDGTGRVTVTYSSSVEAYDASTAAGFQDTFTCTDGHFTALAGMTINAVAVSTSLINASKFAWMQVVTGFNAPGQFAATPDSPVTDPLAAPWSDTTPGGYNVSDICGENTVSAQAFDRLPWYGNNTVGQADLFDQPKNGVLAALGATSMQFETWLVCVLQDGADENDAYTVLPLVGFTWGFQYNYVAGEDGDVLGEYSGTTNFTGFTQGGQPSAAFKTGYAKHWDITYANNPEDCPGCMAPEPGSLLLVMVGMVSWGMVGGGMAGGVFVVARRRRNR